MAHHKLSAKAIDQLGVSVKLRFHRRIMDVRKSFVKGLTVGKSYFMIGASNGGMEMTPEQKIKQLILVKIEEWNQDPDAVQFAKELDAEGVDEQYEALVEAEEHWDGVSETRQGEVETEIPCEWSRHYESKSVAAKAVDGSWVGWTYWYGGGKYAEPEAIDWMSDAYNLDCVEEEKVVTVRTFTKVES